MRVFKNLQINTRLEFIDIYVDVLVHGNAKVVVNCSGIGARKLVGDKLVSPLRGQVSSLRTIFENLRSPEFSAVHNVYFVKYDVTVSFMMLYPIQ